MDWRVLSTTCRAPFRRRAGEHDDELFPAPTRGEIGSPQILAEHGSDGGKDEISARVRPRIVDVLEVIDIEQNDAHRVSMPLAPRDLDRHRGHEGLSIHGGPSSGSIEARRCDSSTSAAMRSGPPSSCAVSGRSLLTLRFPRRRRRDGDGPDFQRAEGDRRDGGRRRLFDARSVFVFEKEELRVRGDVQRRASLALGDFAHRGVMVERELLRRGGANGEPAIRRDLRDELREEIEHPFERAGGPQRTRTSEAMTDSNSAVLRC